MTVSISRRTLLHKVSQSVSQSSPFYPYGRETQKKKIKEIHILSCIYVSWHDEPYVRNWTNRICI